MGLAPEERRDGYLLLGAMSLFLFHYLVWCWPQPFFIEDSAISFSYARNFIDGEGLVPVVGGERIEGYSNALWTLLIALCYAVGIPVWTSAKLLGAVFGMATQYLSYRLAQKVQPTAGWTATLPAFLLGASTQFTLWSASGLENSLFCLLLAGGIYRLVRETDEDLAFPWSALIFFGLTMTRPEGIAYAAVALLGRIMGTVVRRQWLALPAWIVMFAAPYGLYNWWRYNYFAWWWPNTYYAKERVFNPFSWSGTGWKKMREYFLFYGIIFASPAIMVALFHTSRWRRIVGTILLALLALIVLWDGREGLPNSIQFDWNRTIGRDWNKIRVWYLVAMAVISGLLTLGWRGWQARGLLWGSYVAGLFFSVWSGGDWMAGYRWFSLTSVPQFIFIGLGFGLIADDIADAVRALVQRIQKIELPAGPFVVAAAAVLCLALAIPNIPQSYKFAMNPETAVRDVHKRVRYMTWVKERLGIEEVTLLDVDMGAHMWFTDWDIADIAGLIDVSVAHHDWQKAFSEEYIFEERRPDFAHVHGAWAKTTRLTEMQLFRQTYLEIPGYPSGGRSLHVGNHVRKDHIVSKTYTGPTDRTVEFQTGIRLVNWQIPSPEVAPGGRLYVDTTWQAVDRKGGFRVLAFLAGADKTLHVADVAPGYDWYKPDRWESNEYVYGRWNIDLPSTLPEGRYDIGFVVLDEQSGIVLAHVLPEGAAPTPLRYMTGEWLAPASVQIISVEEAISAANADYDVAIQQSKSGDCDGAAATFRDARRHVSRNERWQNTHQATFDTAQIDCYVRRADGLTEPMDKVLALSTARRIDHHSDTVLERTKPLGALLEERGDLAKAEERWDDAYRYYLAALQVDPTRSWARRKVEEVRDIRLGIGENAKKGSPAKNTKAPTKAAIPTATPTEAPKPEEELEEEPEPIEEEEALPAGD